MIGAGTVINPIIKIVTTVAVLAAVYFFIVRPVLDTTENVVGEARKSFEDFNSPSDFAGETARSTATAYVGSLSGPWPAAARHLRQCVDKAQTTRALERCADIGEALVFEAQSDYNFATSYADSLESQGDTAGAKQVRECVKKAEFSPAKMSHCRNLADRLLFG